MTTTDNQGASADLWMHNDMDRDAAESAIKSPRKDLQAAHRRAVDDLIEWRRRALEAESRLAAQPVAAQVEAAPQAEPMTLDNAPLGTKAPAHTGGHWIHVGAGWKWCTGSTFACPGGDWTGDLIAPQAEQVAKAEPVELMGVAEQLEEGAGLWRECSGCYDTEDGHPTQQYDYSKALGCALGNGCSECGGIGAVWDNTDYEAMARDWDKEDDSTPERATAPADLAALQRWDIDRMNQTMEAWASGDYVRFDDVQALLATARAAEGDAPATCWCHVCNKDRTVGGFPYAMTTMILCPTCGNKRCPRANDHRHACTGSNESGQPGSAYPARADQQVSAQKGGAA